MSLIQPLLIYSRFLTVITAMIVFGDRLSSVNSLGLGVVICGVCLFNYHKYTKYKVRCFICTCMIGLCLIITSVLPERRRIS